MNSELYVNVKLKDVTLGDAIRVIHSPERWGIMGASLLTGLSTFTPRDVEGPLIYGDECMVRFNALENSVRLIGKIQLKSRVTITSPKADIPHTTVDTSIVPDQDNARDLMLTMHILSDHRIPFMPQDVRVALQYGFFRCFDPTPKEDDKLILYRQLLKTTSSQAQE